MLAFRTAWTLLIVLACLGAAAGPAGATINLSQFSLTPSTTAAGASANISATVALSPSPDADDVRDLTIALAPGLLANPNVVGTKCTGPQFTLDSCPAGSRIGNGFVDAHIQFLGEFVDVPANVYLLEATAGNMGRVGLVANAFGIKFFAAGPISIRTNPTLGLNVKFENVARSVGDPSSPLETELRRVRLTLNGSVGGSRFTRNPTSCGPATSTLTALSYAGDTKSRSSAFTPTACSALSFAPKVSSVATVGVLGSLALSTAIAQSPGEAALKRASLTLPPAIAPRLSALPRACGATDPASCPSTASVGQALVDSPLLPAAVTGRVVLRKGSPLPGLALVFPPPLPLKLEGTTGLTSLGLRTTFDSLPDVPINRLDVAFKGGLSSLFTGAGLCLKPAVLRGSFTGQNGASASDSSNIAVAGCTFPTPTATISLRRLSTASRSLRLVVEAPESAGQFGVVSLKLPRGLRLNEAKVAKRLKLRVGGKRGGATVKASGKRLKLKVSREGVRRIVLRLKGRALKVSKALKRRVQTSRAKKLRFTVKVLYTGDGKFKLRPRARPR